MRFLKNGKSNDQICLVVYLDAFDKKMSYLLRDKEPKTLHQEFMMAIEIENNIKYGLTRSHFFRNVCWKDEVQKIDHCHKEYLISDQQIGTPTIVNNFVENLELKTCADEVYWFQGRDEFVLAECSAHVSIITTKDDRVDSFDKNMSYLLRGKEPKICIRHS